MFHVETGYMNQRPVLKLQRRQLDGEVLARAEGPLSGGGGDHESLEWVEDGCSAAGGSMGRNE